jgi:hypothetical protein
MLPTTAKRPVCTPALACQLLADLKAAYQSVRVIERVAVRTTIGQVAATNTFASCKTANTIVASTCYVAVPISKLASTVF